MKIAFPKKGEMHTDTHTQNGWNILPVLLKLKYQRLNFLMICIKSIYTFVKKFEKERHIFNNTPGCNSSKSPVDLFKFN